MVALNGFPRASADWSGRKSAGWSARRPRGDRAAHTAGTDSWRKALASATGSAPILLLRLLRARLIPELRHRRVEAGERLRSPLPELRLQAVELGVEPLPAPLCRAAGI